ncbi:large subunit ribosomal protein L25 [Paenibacillus cellulosilyticus]|uniref:Large ribosomal subunit protein bL25 n=1 Tax=Paenibacillus cellulosilyticus TaxID=375489 RepID=A0A2V2YPC3_9BACL|nr:50S ribosomal protein L25 [Paenibacillus cellulosilyticus]PWV95951.1 large subunit ribosomal protein L25 [Paenibacillus cellulosilyticus]QKS48421.1 50S ribosomal protein L25 [Paenibacillus cellulosilyticus]
MGIPLTIETRATKTRRELRELRSQGKVPGVVYGPSLQAPKPIALSERELLPLLRSHPNAVLSVSIPGGLTESVVISEVQRDPLTHEVVHIDLHQINMNKKLRTHVRLEATGDSKGEREGGILQLLAHELEIECLPNQLPEVISFDVTSLGVGENMLVRDIPVPAGVTVRSDAEQVVVTILAPQLELSEEEAAAQAVELHEAESRSKHEKMEAVKTGVGGQQA